MIRLLIEEGDVTPGQEAVTQDGEAETPSTPASGEETPDSNTGQPAAGTEQPVVDPEKLQAQIKNLNKALETERTARKEAQRKVAQSQGSRMMEGYDPKSLEQVQQHPAYQDLALKNAEYELREGVKDILKEYSNIPQNIAGAIIRNPRGFVNQGTSDVQNALLDITDYLEGIAGSFEPAAPPAPQPKNVPIMGNNKVGTQQSDTEIQQILEIPPEDWTPEQEKAIAEYNKANKR